MGKRLFSGVVFQSQLVLILRKYKSSVIKHCTVVLLCLCFLSSATILNQIKRQVSSLFPRGKAWQVKGSHMKEKLYYRESIKTNDISCSFLDKIIENNAILQYPTARHYRQSWNQA